MIRELEIGHKTQGTNRENHCTTVLDPNQTPAVGAVGPSVYERPMFLFRDIAPHLEGLSRVESDLFDRSAVGMTADLPAMSVSRRAKGPPFTFC